MKRIIFMAIALVAFTQFDATAQKENSFTYKTALGVKFYPGAITLKHFIKSDVALEGIGYLWKQGTRITGLYEFHGNIEKVDGLKWYIGPGAHIGLYNNKYYGGATAIGIDGVLGLDYKIRSAPINLSLDWQPSFEFGNYAGFSGDWGGLSIRYTF